jgi:hypothetical protein
MFKIMIINVFLWSILASKHPPKNNVSRVESYTDYEHEIKID